MSPGSPPHDSTDRKSLFPRTIKTLPGPPGGLKAMLNRDFRLFGFAIGLALAVAISHPAGATLYNEAVLADNPAYYWTFDEDGVVNAIEQVQGLAADEFVPGANAAKVDSATTGGGVSLGQAARIEESGGFTWNVSDLSGSGMSGAWAYEFWANADDITTYEYMI